MAAWEGHPPNGSIIYEEAKMLNKMFKKVAVLLFGFLLGACMPLFSGERFPTSPGSIGSSDPNLDNGARIYFTGTNADGKRIPYSGGPNFGRMMMGSYLTCAACHGPDGRGGVHWMHMQVMNAPDIRYVALSGEAEEHRGDKDEAHAAEHAEYDLDDFRLAVVEGKHPNGEPLSPDMPRWQMSDKDLADLFLFLKSLR